MPIRRDHRHHYTQAAGWPALRERILKRASADRFSGIARCELCGAPNRMPIVRKEDVPALWDLNTIPNHPRAVIVVLTIHHINHDPTDNRDCNLIALCQRCHNRLDAPWRGRQAAETRAAKALHHD